MTVKTAVRTKLPLLGALVSVVLWASAFIGIRAAGRGFSPGGLALGRLIVGSLVLGAFFLTRPKMRPTHREVGLLLIAGLIWFGLYNVVLNAAEQRVDAGTAAMLVGLGPLLIMAFAAAFLKERLSRSVLLGGAIAFAGVLIIGLATRSSNAPLSGVVLCLVAAVAYAAGVVAQKPLVNRLPGLEVTWLCCTIGALTCLPYAPALVRDVSSAPASSIAWLVYLGVFPTSIGFTTWAYALAHTSAGRLGATTYLVPPIAIIMSWLILGEIPGLIAVGGGAICLLGVYIARRSPRPPSETGVTARPDHVPRRSSRSGERQAILGD